MTEMEHFAHDARKWALQTIIFTLQYGLTVKTAAEEPAQVAQLSKESAAITARLWTIANAHSTNLSQALHRFVWLVLEWSSEHLPENEAVRS